ncbi:MAG TPA: heat-inducible transcriptional repressor HrcA, partial [Steroidobacteraceae bacterium]|nr:heat-inducible transcriptional repressor HrcA [Steroidobacteraceae bacterium]
MSPESEDILNDRAQQLLRILVEQYIRDGQPVGSRTLSRESGMSLSSATIRNVMADLEELGFVSSPHTSAGRMPTNKGYRFFVDTLLKIRPLENEAVQIIQQGLVPHGSDPKSLVAQASRMLSSITQLAGVVTLPRPAQTSLSQIEFLALSDNRVLAVLVTNGREIQNRVVQLDRQYSSEELRRAANYLNQQFAGRDISDVRTQLLQELQQTREHLNQGMLDAVMLAQQAVAPTDPSPRMEYVIAGETNLMGFAELSNVEKLRRLFEAFNQQRDILHLLDQSLGADGVQIFIGQESGYTMLDDCSVVTAPYMLDKEAVGVLAV